MYQQPGTPLNLDSTPLGLKEEQCASRDWQRVEQHSGYYQAQEYDEEEEEEEDDDDAELSDSDDDGDGGPDFQAPGCRPHPAAQPTRFLTRPMHPTNATSAYPQRAPAGPLPSGNKSSFRGVSFDKKKRKWRVQIKVWLLSRF
jgi:hypothetical protein